MKDLFQLIDRVKRHPATRGAPSPPHIQHGQARRDTRPLWYALGWRQEGIRLFGSYRAGKRYWDGEIREPVKGRLEVYIENAPAFVLTGPHRACFRPDYSRSQHGDSVHSVHMSPAPRNPEEAIHAVEKILSGVN